MTRRALLHGGACLLGSQEGRPLFDGNSFDGWRDPGQLSPAGDSWRIEDGALSASRDPHLLEDLVTESAYGDFDLEFSWKLDRAGNSGIKYCLVEEVFFENTEPGWAKGRRVSGRQFAAGTDRKSVV